MGKGKNKKKKKAAETTDSSGKRIKTITDNRKARHLYHIDDQIEAGLQLTGTEVKSCRENKANLVDAYADEKRGEFFLRNAHINEYRQGTYNNHEPRRPRKILMHKKEIDTLLGKVREKGYTLVPMKLYFKGPWIKVLLGLGRGKKLYDKRADLKEKQAKRDVERALKHRG